MKLYNTLTKRKEEFVPLEPGKVGKCMSAGPRSIISSISGTQGL